MPSTPIYDLPYSASTSAPAGYAQQEALAEKVEATFQTLGAVVHATTGATASSGFSLDSFEAFKKFASAMVRIAVVRTGPDIPAGTGGGANSNITNVVVGTIPPEWRPSFTMVGNASDQLGFGSVRFESNGQVTLDTWSTGNTIATGRTVTCTCSYVLLG